MQKISVLSRVSNLINELRVKLPNITFHEVTAPDKDEEFENSEIIIADFDLLAPHIKKLNKTKWIQGTWAGADFLVSKLENKPSFIITRFTGEHFGRLMTEYVITNIVNHERQLYKVHENQQNKIWARDDAIFYYRSIADLTIGILGVGTIGNRIGNVLHMLGAKILGYGRREALELSNDNFYLEKYYNKQQLPEFLKHCDYIVNVLPNTPETVGLLGGTVLRNCAEKNAIFINIGRGTIISEDDLINAIVNKWLSAAVLDVFTIEPLPENSRLWKMPQVYITPHVAGVTRAKDVAEQFTTNLQLFNSNKHIPSTINFEKGY